MIQIGMPFLLHIWLNFPIYLLFGSILLLVCSWACKYRSKKDQESDRTYFSTRTSATHPDRKKYRTASASQTIQLVMCPECEATIQADEAVCPHCGSSRPICTVCHQTIEYGESILLCPHCNARAHRVHLLEYLKVKGTCPNCQADLDEFELLESDLHSDDQKKLKKGNRLRVFSSAKNLIEDVGFHLMGHSNTGHFCSQR